METFCGSGIQASIGQVEKVNSSLARNKFGSGNDIEAETLSTPAALAESNILRKTP